MSGPMPGRPVTRRLAWEMVATLVLCAVVLVTMLYVGTGREGRRYDLNSGGAEGLLALRLWLTELGYQVGTTDGEQFQLPADADLLLVYPNSHPYSRAEAETVRRWVQQGRTLVLVGPARQDRALAEVFGVHLTRPSDLSPLAPLRPLAPVLPAVPLELGRVGTEAALDLTAVPGALPIVGTDAGPPLQPAATPVTELLGDAAAEPVITLALQRLGRGSVWHLSLHHDLVNEKLKNGQAGLVPALLREVPLGGRVVFDTYHLFGPQAQRVATLQELLYTTAVGWSVLLAVGLLVIYWLLSGRRLGPPLPGLTPTRRREAAEHVTAMAGLYRRARLGNAVASHHHQRLKQELARGYQVSPDLGDEEFLFHLRRAADGRLAESDLERIRQLLTGLSGQPDEAALVRLVAGVEAVLERR